jgi:error-prone DNA polymerase
MERFLNLRRKSLPDIDIDVESVRPEAGGVPEHLRPVRLRAGRHRVHARDLPRALRDAGAALGIDAGDTGRLAKAFPHIRARDARAAMAELPELASVARHAGHYGRLWDLVEGLDALPRGIAMHPSGVLLSDATLLERTPVIPTTGEGFPMSVFNKDDVEDMGLLSSAAEDRGGLVGALGGVSTGSVRRDGFGPAIRGFRRWPGMAGGLLRRRCRCGGWRASGAVRPGSR